MEKFFQNTAPSFFKNERLAGGFRKLIKGGLYLGEYRFCPLNALTGSNDTNVGLHDGTFHLIAYFLGGTFIHRFSARGVFFIFFPLFFFYTKKKIFASGKESFVEFIKIIRRMFYRHAGLYVI